MPIDFEHLPFVQAYWSRKWKEGARKPRIIVLHSTESGETEGGAAAVAGYFRRGCPDERGRLRKASAHYVISATEVIQCLQTRDEAFGAGGCNRVGVHLEQVGRAAQTREQWLDSYSREVIRNAATLCGKVLAPKYGIQPVFLQGAGLKKAVSEGGNGFTTHAECSKMFGGTHSDPGIYFPFDVFRQDWIDAEG